MGRLINLLSWELNDHLKVLITALGMLVMGYVFQHDILISVGEFGTVSTSVNGLNSMSGFVITRAITSEDFWVIASFFIAVLVALTFRAGIEGGYELTTYSLPYSKSEIFVIKFLVSLLLSVLIVFLPFLVLVSVNFAETPRFVLSLLTGERFIGLLVIILMAIFYVLSITLFLSTVLRNMFAALIFAFPILVVPYLMAVNLPPGNFLKGAAEEVSIGSYFSLHQFLLHHNVIGEGFILPLIISILSFLILLKRDVR